MEASMEEERAHETSEFVEELGFLTNLAPPPSAASHVPQSAFKPAIAAVRQPMQQPFPWQQAASGADNACAFRFQGHFLRNPTQVDPSLHHAHNVRNGFAPFQHRNMYGAQETAADLARESGLGQGGPEPMQYGQQRVVALEPQQVQANDTTQNPESAPAKEQTTKKRGRAATGKAPRKPRATKKPKLSEEDAKALEEGKKNIWKTDWGVKLIAARSRMDDAFNNPKQGVDLWAKIALEILAACPDFDKNAEACRQKFKAIMKQYQNDKAQNAKSGSNRGDQCSFFEQMDEKFGTKATVQCVAHVSASSSNHESKADSEKPVSRKDQAKQDLREMLIESQDGAMDRLEAIENKKMQTLKEGFGEITGFLKMLLQSGK